MEKALGNQQRKIHVLVARSFEALIKLALQQLPDGVAVGFDDHAPFHDFRGLGHIASQNNVLIPTRKVVIACSDGRFGHFGAALSVKVEISRERKSEESPGMLYECTPG